MTSTCSWAPGSGWPPGRAGLSSLPAQAHRIYRCPPRLHLSGHEDNFRQQQRRRRRRTTISDHFKQAAIGQPRASSRATPKRTLNRKWSGKNSQSQMSTVWWMAAAVHCRQNGSPRMPHSLQSCLTHTSDSVSFSLTLGDTCSLMPTLRYVQAWRMNEKSIQSITWPFKVISSVSLYWCITVLYF